MKRLNAAQLPFENRERDTAPPTPPPAASRGLGALGPVGSRWQSLELCPEPGARPVCQSPGLLW